LELAGKLGANRKLTEASKLFRDRRYKGTKPFFHDRSELSRQLAELRTPNLAKKWGWQMNMGLDAFESTFEKVGRAAIST
jgi:hypothetical protein